MSELDLLIDKAAKKLRQLTKLQTTKKMSYPAFFREALKIAGCDEKRIDEIEEQVKGLHFDDGLSVFLRRLIAQFRQPEWSRPHPDVEKLFRLYGSGGVVGSNPSIAEVQALAVKMTNARYGDAVFGDIDDLDKHHETITDLREEIDGFYSDMRQVVSGADLEFDTTTLLPDERKRGLVFARFKRSPQVVFGDEEWPRLLTENCESAIPLKRVVLAKAGKRKAA